METTDKRYCDKGIGHGLCCCNCTKRMQVNCHPANTIAKGSITKKFAYVCMEVFEDKSGTPTIMEWEHWGCELHHLKKDNEDVGDENEVGSFLQQFKFLADSYLRALEKTTPMWEKRTIPIAHSELNDFYCWIKNANKKVV